MENRGTDLPSVQSGNLLANRPVPSDWKHNNQYCFVVLQPKQQSTVLCRASLVAQVEEEAEDSIEVKDLCTLLKKHPEKQKLLQRLKCCRCLL